MDSDIEIDPDLFLKCRLCINNTGSYHIHQSLQQQIKFCFDITVKHDDCMSQLLCKSCKKNVSEFNTAKIQYLENQNILCQKLKAIRLGKVEKGANNNSKNTRSEEDSSNESDKNSNKENNNATKSAAVSVGTRPSSSSEHDEEVVNNKLPKNIKTKRLSTSSSCTVSESVISEQSSHANYKIAQKTLSWTQFYRKKFMCRFCYVVFSSQKRINKHVKRHSKLLIIQKTHIKKFCKIEMERIEGIPNLTGENKAVVLNPNNIIMNDGNDKYCVKYFPKLTNYHMNDEHKRSILSSRKIDSGDTSEDDFETKPRKKKRLRLRTSSNETVVIDASARKGSEDNEKIKYTTNTKRFGQSEDSSDVQCINVEDSSNDSNQYPKPTDQTIEKDLQIVHDIISGCYKKYLCNRDNEAQNDKGTKSLDLELLNKKLYSTGRKDIMSTGVGTPGLLKYLQHKNLAINWTALPQVSNLSKPVVRIMARVALPEHPYNTVMPNSYLGWLPVKETNETPETEVQESTPNLFSMNEKLVENVYTPENKTVINNITPHNHDMANITQIKQEKKNDQVKMSHLRQLLDSDSVLFQEADSVKSKLLNANPVANPKQLPRKNVAHEVKGNAPSAAEPASNKLIGKNNIESIFIDSDDEILHNDQNSQLHLPIITSTTSLAIEHTKVNEHATQNSVKECLKNQSGKPVLRLKCKPVSELMPQSAAHCLFKNATVIENNVAIVNSNIIKLPEIAPKPPNIEVSSGVIMNSVDLPNTSTLRPVEYFKTLLQMHNMTLISQVNHKLSADFANLVKFRLELTQFDKSAVLSLALFANCTGVIFCLKIGNNNEEMDIDILPAHWQVRILKSFRGEVSQKILECAQKINRSLHDNARQFVLLLQNIEFKSDIK